MLALPSKLIRTFCQVWSWGCLLKNWPCSRCLGGAQATWLCFHWDGSKWQYTFRPVSKFSLTKVNIVWQWTFQDRRDATDACKELDGTRLCGNRVKVEMSNGGKGGRGGGGGGRGRSRWIFLFAFWMFPFTWVLLHICSDLILHNWKQPIAGARTEEVEAHQGGEGAAAGAGEEAGAGKLLLSSHFFCQKKYGIETWSWFRSPRRSRRSPSYRSVSRGRDRSKSRSAPPKKRSRWISSSLVTILIRPLKKKCYNNLLRSPAPRDAGSKSRSRSRSRS